MSLKDSQALDSRRQNNNKVKLIAEILIVIIFAIVAASVVNGSVFVSTRVSGASMNNTLYGGGDPSVEDGTYFDKFFFGGADRYGDKVVMVRTQKVERSDIIVFKHENEQYIKRVIGVAGDVIELSGGYVYLNGERLSESYAVGKTFSLLSGVRKWTVGGGEVFVMGDNRENSSDSREFGCVATSTIIGRVFLIIKKDTKTLEWVTN